MRALRVLEALVAAMLALAVARCSTSSVAGGTETENPDVSTAAVMAFNALGDTARWSVRSYVPGGLGRIDSAQVMGGGVYRHPGGTLAKQWVERDDTIIDTFRYVTYTIYTDDTLLVRDTTLRQDTFYVDDTLVVADTTMDTVVAVEQGDTTRTVQTTILTDSLFVVDTVVRLDTVVRVDTVLIRDTSVIHDTLPLVVDSSSTIGLDTLILTGGDTASVTLRPGTSGSFAVMEMRANSALQPEYYWTTANLPPIVQPVPADAYTVANERATVLVTKQMYSVSGAVVNERYGDLDGDAKLFGVGFQQLRFSHDYVHGTDSVNATADIDNGSDHSFSSVPGNAVQALVNRTSTSAYVRHTTYMPRLGSGIDTLSLTVFELLRDSSLELYSQAYRFRRGTDMTRGNDDSLRVWEASAVYNTGDVRRMDLEVRFDRPVRSGLSPSVATLTLTIWFADGSVGYLGGARMDFGSGTISGTYYREGEAQSILIDREGNAVR